MAKSKKVDSQQMKIDAPFVNSAQLSDINLLRCVYDIEEDRVREKGKGRLKLNLEIEPSFSNPKGSNKSRDLQGKFTISLAGETEKGERIFSLDLVYVAIYKIADNHDWPQEEVEHFVEKNMMLHVWPYLREFVDQITSRSVIPHVVLPLIPLKKGFPVSAKKIG